MPLSSYRQFEPALAYAAEATEQTMDRLLPKGETGEARVFEAMRYSSLGGGKRLRAFFVLASSTLFKVSATSALRVASAIEFLHAYSLVHDDLPAMDNDDLRRGKPTCHKQFNEATAILAGDALLTLAFETLSRIPTDAARCVHVIREISSAAGTRDGMVGGQVADIEAERKPVTAEMLSYIHKSKTAALIRGSVIAGTICGGGNSEDVERMRRFGDNIGWAFQVVDDILDVEESSAALGKTAGKDQAQQKATYPALFGLQKSRSIAKELEAKALKELDCYGQRAARLRELGQFLVARRS